MVMTVMSPVIVVTKSPEPPSRHDQQTFALPTLGGQASSVNSLGMKNPKLQCRSMVTIE